MTLEYNKKFILNLYFNLKNIHEKRYKCINFSHEETYVVESSTGRFINEEIFSKSRRLLTVFWIQRRLSRVARYGTSIRHMIRSHTRSRVYRTSYSVLDSNEKGKQIAQPLYKYLLNAAKMINGARERQRDE